MNVINKRSAIILVSGILFLVAVACDKSAKYEREELEKIDNYLLTHPDFVFEEKPSGLYYSDIEFGTGLVPATHDTAYIKYTGKFLTGTVFDTNIDTDGDIDTLIRPVNEGYLIPGFDEGITYMIEGGKAIFLVPSSLGYGPNDFYDIPGYTPLLFEVELLRVVPGPGK